MDCNILGCQVCLTTFQSIGAIKKHMQSERHQKKMKEVFQKDMVRGSGFFPFIIVMNLQATEKSRPYIVGLSLLTLCFSTETKTSFYLCHVCEDKCLPERIVCHLYSGDHCSNYFNYTDPNVLTFSWLPSLNMKYVLREALTKERNDRGIGQLQMLDLPGNLMQKLENGVYSDVMQTLCENDKLVKVFEAVKPARMTIQTYQRDSNRRHPLLGIQHLVECICVGPTEKSYYLCTLCNLTLATHMIIKHVLSFDHIFCFFREWHPSTLLSKVCYTDYSSSFASTMLDFAKQAEEIHGTANMDLKQVCLDPDKFRSVNFSCYAEALKDLQDITKDNSLTTTIVPKNRLVCCRDAVPEELSCKLRCQNCSVVFENIFLYFKHVVKLIHKRVVEKFCSEAERAPDGAQTGPTPSLGLYTYIKQSLKQNKPVIGAPLIVTCICTQVEMEPVYLCFACHDCLTESSVRSHLNSQKHLISTLLYYNPWQLPFAWSNHMDVQVLRSKAWEEEKERAPNLIKLKVLDIPYSIFWHLSPSYHIVMKRLAGHHLYPLLKHEVPECETYSKLKENETFPLLGQQFLVIHDVYDPLHQSTGVRFLCLLCKRRLPDEEGCAHLFSRQHVVTYLAHFHPGSIKSNTDAETLLDLAKQAAQISSKSRMQVIKLDNPIWEPCNYKRATLILGAAKRRVKNESLLPPIVPKMKLVPRENMKDTDKGNIADNSQETSRITSQKSTANSGTTPRDIPVKVDAEITDPQGVVVGKNKETKDNKDTPVSGEKESESGEVFLKTSSEEINSAGSENGQVIKEEKRVETPERCQNIDQADGNKTGEGKSQNSNNVLTRLKNCMSDANKRERESSISENPQDTCPHEGEDKKNVNKRQRVTFDPDLSCEQPYKQKRVIPAEEGESAKASYESKSKGFGLLTECHCDQCKQPISHCSCCSMKISEMDFINHVTGADHQRLLPTHPDKNTRHSRALLEQDNGYKDAPVVDLDKENHSKLLKQNSKPDVQTMKALKAQVNRLELSVTSVPSAVHPLDTVVTQFDRLTDDSQVVDMEIVGSDDSEADSSSVTSAGPAKLVMTQINSKTAEIPEKDAKPNKVLESAGMANICVAVSRSSEDASSLCVSISQTDTTCLHADSTGNNLKAEIASNPLKMVGRSKIIRSSQNVAGSDSMMTNSKRPARSFNAPSNTTQSKAPISTPRAATSSCTSRTAYTHVASTSSTRTTTNKRTATNPDSSTTSKNSDKPQTTNASQATIVFQTKVTSAATVKIMGTSIRCKASGPSAKTMLMRKSVGPNADFVSGVQRSSTLIDPRLAKLTSVRSESKNPPTVPSDTSTRKTKRSESPPKVGLNQLITVSCEGRQQVYCQLCSVRLKQSTHVISFSHRYNYVKMKCPEFTAKPSELESKVNCIVAHLAESEKDVGPRPDQRLQVKIDMYKALAALPETEALKRLKILMRHRDSQVSSPETNSAEVFKLQAASTSPSEASSLDDGMCIPQNEMPGVSTDDQVMSTEQELKHELQTLVQFSETKSFSKEESDLALGQSDRAKSLKSSEPTTNDMISDQFPDLNENKPDPIATPIIQDADIEVNVKQEKFESEVESQTIEVKPANEIPAVKMEKLQSCGHPLATDPEPTSRFAQSRSPYHETAVTRQQQGKAHASVNIEQQNQSRPSGTAEHAPKRSGCSPGPGYQSASLALESISIGKRTQCPSHLSTYLKVMGQKPVIGMGLVWECRGIFLNPFFLCESCKETLHNNNICQHMVSEMHRYNYVRMQYPQFLSSWPDDLLPEMRQELLTDITFQLSKQECHEAIDAQVVLLREDLYECALKAPFSEGSTLKMVQNIKKEPKLNNVCQPIGTQQQNGQQPEDSQSQEESLFTEKPSTQALETGQRRNNEARQQTEKCHLEENLVFGDLDGVKQRQISSPLDVTSVFSKASSDISPLPDGGMCHSPHKTFRSLSVQLEVRALACHHQGPVPDMQLQQMDILSESLSSPVSCLTNSQTLSVSSTDKCLPTRKRKAVTSLETLVRPGTNSPQLEEPLPATYTSTPVNPAATSTLLSPENKGAKPVCNQEDAVFVDKEKLANIITVVRERKSKINMSAPEKVTTAPCTENSSKIVKKQTRWDLKWRKFAVKKNQTSTESLEMEISSAAPVVSGDENQCAPNANPALSANNSSHLVRGDLSFGVTEDEGTMVPSVSTAQSMLGNVSQFKQSPFPFIATSHNPDQRPQLQSHTEADSTRGCHLPINTIITTRQDPATQTFMGSYNGEFQAEVNKGCEVTHSFSTIATVTPSDTLAVSGAYGHCSQMTDVTNKVSSYVPSASNSGYTTPDDPPVYMKVLNPQEGFNTKVFYPNQIYPEHEANHLTYSLATPASLHASWVRLEMQQHQQQLMLQQQHMMQRQLMLQQQLVQPQPQQLLIQPQPQQLLIQPQPQQQLIQPQPQQQLIQPQPQQQLIQPQQQLIQPQLQLIQPQPQLQLIQPQLIQPQLQLIQPQPQPIQPQPQPIQPQPQPIQPQPQQQQLIQPQQQPIQPQPQQQQLIQPQQQPIQPQPQQQLIQPQPQQQLIQPQQQPIQPQPQQQPIQPQPQQQPQQQPIQPQQQLIQPQPQVQQQLIQPQQQLSQLQPQPQQQYYSSWTAAATAVEGNKGTAEAVYFAVTPFTIPANSSQTFF